jgi:glycosyltransferase involved in cell wall biosynthesis
VKGQQDTRLPVSVVIPAFNRGELLVRALRSVASQEPRRPAEVIVVDDGSTDDTAEVGDSWGARVISHPRNLGVSAAKQTGFEAAREPWVALLGSDDEWLPEHLGILWLLTPGHVFVAASSIECDPNSTERRFHGAVAMRTRILTSPRELLHPENPVADSAAMVQRNVALAVGGFRGGLCEDLDFWCRVLSRGRGALSPRIGVVYHVHSGQLSDDWEAMHEAHLDVARSYATERWWSRRLVERRTGVTAWDRFRAQQREGARAALRTFLLGLLAHPPRIRGVLEVWRHRLAVRRRASRLSRSGTPSVAVLPGCDSVVIPEQDRYEVDLSAAGSVAAFRRLLMRPSARAVVRSRRQAALVRLAGIRPTRVAELDRASAEDAATT